MTYAFELLPVLRDGLLLALVVLLLAAFGLYAAYRWAWREPQWYGARRHATSPFLMVDWWIHLRWLHFDAEYWLLPVDFREGPVEIVGVPPEATYWSLAWYDGTAPRGSINDREVEVEDDGRYVVRVAEETTGANRLELDPEVGRSVLYFRVYQPAQGARVPLPEVRQDGCVLARGGAP